MHKRSMMIRADKSKIIHENHEKKALDFDWEFILLFTICDSAICLVLRIVIEWNDEIVCNDDSL